MLPFLQEPVHTTRDFDAWVYQHYNDHQEMIDNIRRLSGNTINLTMYPINIYTESVSYQWKYWHQLMHQDLANNLGITVNDLETVNFNDIEDARQWFYLNLRDHEAAHAAIGI